MIDKEQLYKTAWAKWGKLQFLMMMEEPAELIKAVSKFIRNGNDENLEHISEEIADVEIMAEQFRTMYPEYSKKADEYKERKLERLKEMLEMRK